MCWKAGPGRAGMPAPANQNQLLLLLLRFLPDQLIHDRKCLYLSLELKRLLFSALTGNKAHRLITNECVRAPPRPPLPA